LAFVLRSLDEPAVHVHVTARQRKRVDVGGVDDLELIGERLSRSDRRETIADPIDIGFDRLVVENRQLLLRGLRGLSADLLILRRGEKIEAGLDMSLRDHRVGSHGHERRETQRNSPGASRVGDHVVLR
jgi:hypothetical protein